MSELFLTTEIYPVFAISRAVAAFEDLAQIQTELNPQYSIIHFSNSRYPLEQTMKEFENYVIDVICQEKQW